MEIYGEMPLFRYHFFKDRTWLWALLLPIGIILWAAPFFLFFAIKSPQVSQLIRVIIAFIVFGIPAYLLGYVFIYNFTDGLFSQVKFDHENIFFRTPWKLIPIFMVTKRIPVENIWQIHYMVRYGIAHFAVQVITVQSGRKSTYFLPQFNDNLSYLQILKEIQSSKESPDRSFASMNDLKNYQEKLKKAEKLKDVTEVPQALSHKVIQVLEIFTIIIFLGFSGWITSSLPMDSIYISIGFGIVLAIVCVVISFVGLLPGIGQIIIWFFGHGIILSMIHFLGIFDVKWVTPLIKNDFLIPFTFPAISTTLSKFLFWMILLLSIEISINTLFSWLERKNAKEYRNLF